jgi:hypothetical protein
LKLRHWINLFVVVLAAGLLTYLTYHWALTSYAEPTCRRYAESQGLTYAGYIPPDIEATTGTSHMSRDGNCQLSAASGEMRTESLVGASGSPVGAPFLVSMALNWQIVFGAAFIGVAFALAMFWRLVAPGMAKA